MAQYDDVAEGYARLIAPRYAPIAEFVAGRVLAEPMAPGATVVEVAAGTGLLTSRLVASLAPGGRLLATDIAVPMLARAVGSVGRARVEYVAASAFALPFADATAALVASSLGPVQEDVALFAEARRVLAPGGRLVIGFWGTGYTELTMLQQARSRLGLGDFPVAPVEAAVGRCREAGFTDVRTTSATLDVEHASVADYLSYRRSFGWPPWIPADRREEWLPAVEEVTRAAYVGEDGRVRFTWTVVALEARRPAAA